MQDKNNQLTALLNKITTSGDASIYPFDVSELVIDAAIQLKCQIPLCANYGQSKMCPPNLPPLSIIREAMQSYQQGYLVVLEKSMQGLTPEQKNKESKVLEMKLLELINEMENAAIAQGFYKAIGLAAGSCKMCETCAPSGEPCKHPYKARPGPSGMGMDVTALAIKKGVEISWPPKDKLLSIGLLLV